MKSIVSNEQLVEIKSDLELANPTNRVRAWQIQAVIQDKFNTKIDESTIRGRFIVTTPMDPVESPDPKSPPVVLRLSSLKSSLRRQHIDLTSLGFNGLLIKF